MAQGILTTEGLNKAIEASNNDGWYIKPLSFGVSELVGSLVPSRDYASVLSQWYQGSIASVVKISANLLQFNCIIPANADTIPRFTKEVYIYGIDNLSQPYLLGVAQPSNDLVYDPEGELRIRIQIKIDNLDISNLFSFEYTQATEVSDHNNDLNAHPPIQTALNKAGIFTQLSQRTYNGQGFDQFPIKSVSVVDKTAVYYDTVNQRYDVAIDDGLFPQKRNAVGVYIASKDVVVYKGIIDYPHSLPPYTKLYLSSLLAGQFSASPSTVIIGHTLPDSKLYVDIFFDDLGQLEQDPDGDTNVKLIPPTIKELTLVDTNLVKWDVKVDAFGTLYTEPNSTREPNEIFRIPKTNLSFAQIRVDTDGVLLVESPPSNPTAVIDEFFYLEDPNGIAWKITVDNTNAIVMKVHENIFSVQSENAYHFVVKQTDTEHALTYTQVYDALTLPSTPPVYAGTLPFCFYDNGVDKRLIFHDGSSWKYVHDNSAV